MTINGAIAIANLVFALALLGVAGALLYQARRGLIAWPVSALVALAGPFGVAGLVLLHLTLFRMVDLTPAFEADGFGTLAIRVVGATVAVALARRIATGRLLTTQDRHRVDAR